MAQAERDWATYYRESSSVDVFLTNLFHHRAFVERLLGFAPRRTLEAGCGTAGMSVFLALTGVQATAADVDEGVLAIARENAARWNAPVEVVSRDLFALSAAPERYDLVFSQGVLEHFDDERIVAACTESLAVAPAFAFSVPSNFYGVQDFGDERLMTGDQWRAILGRVDADVSVEPYLAERRKRTFLLRRPLMLMAVLTRR